MVGSVEFVVTWPPDLQPFITAILWFRFVVEIVSSRRGCMECMVRRQIASSIFGVGGLVCANVSGLFLEFKLLAMMESARRWSTKWVELPAVLIATQT